MTSLLHINRKTNRLGGYSILLKHCAIWKCGDASCTREEYLYHHTSFPADRLIESKVVSLIYYKTEQTHKRKIAKSKNEISRTILTYARFDIEVFSFWASKLCNSNYWLVSCVCVCDFVVIGSVCRLRSQLNRGR